MLKRLRDKVRAVAVVSLAASLVSLLIVLAIVDSTIASWFLGLGTLIVSLIEKTKPEWLDFIILKWNSLATLTHWSLLFFEVAGLIYLVGYFFKNYHIKIVPNDSGTTSTSR
jgi:hypothetical protein